MTSFCFACQVTLHAVVILYIRAVQVRWIEHQQLLQTHDRQFRGTENPQHLQSDDSSGRQHRHLLQNHDRQIRETEHPRLRQTHAIQIRGTEHRLILSIWNSQYNSFLM